MDELHRRNSASLMQSRGEDVVVHLEPNWLQPTRSFKAHASQPQPQPLQRSTVPDSSCTMNLINCLTGAGVLGYPFCFKSCGLVLGTCIMVCCALACRFSYQLLLYCCQLSGKNSYDAVAKQAYGTRGKKLVELCVAAINLGSTVAYINILADVLSSVAGTIIPPGAEPTRGGYITGVTFLGALPVALMVRDSSVIAALSAGSVGIVLMFSVAMLVFAISPSSAFRSQEQLTLWNSKGLLLSLPVMAYSFTAHPFYLGIYSMMHQPTVRRMSHVTNVALSLCALMYWVVGMGGYLRFGNKTHGDVLRNLGGVYSIGLQGAYQHGLKLCYGLSILGSIPLMIIPLHGILTPLLQFPVGRRRTSPGSRRFDASRTPSPLPPEDPEESQRHHKSHSALENPGPSLVQHVIICVFILTLAMSCALWLPNVEFIFGLTGATASVMVAYIMPALIFLKLSSPPKRGSPHAKQTSRIWILTRRMAMVLALGGILCGGICTRAILTAVKEEREVVQLAQDLVAREVGIAEANRAQELIKGAAMTVSAVGEATQQLSDIDHQTNKTRDQLQLAAATLEKLHEEGGGHGKVSTKAHTVWDLGAHLQDRQRQQERLRTYQALEQLLLQSMDHVGTTLGHVTDVAEKVESSLEEVRKHSKREESGTTGTTDTTGDLSAAAGNSAAARAHDLAHELMTALGPYWEKTGRWEGEIGESLTQVHSTASIARNALNETLAKLKQVHLSISQARIQGRYNASVATAAVSEMQQALNATQSSAIAMQMMREALAAAADEESYKLISALGDITTGTIRQTHPEQQAKVMDQEALPGHVKVDQVLPQPVGLPDRTKSMLVDVRNMSVNSSAYGLTSGEANDDKGNTGIEDGSGPTHKAAIHLTERLKNDHTIMGFQSESTTQDQSPGGWDNDAVPPRLLALVNDVLLAAGGSKSLARAELVEHLADSVYDYVRDKALRALIVLEGRETDEKGNTNTVLQQELTDGSNVVVDVRTHNVTEAYHW